MTPQDGAVLAMLGREFEVHAGRDEDGGYAYVTCCVCDGFVRLSDDAMQDHQCKPVDCPDCDGDGIVFDHVNYWGKAEDQPCARCSGTGLVNPLVLT